MKKKQKIKAIRQPPFFARKAAQETEWKNGGSHRIAKTSRTITNVW